MRVTYFQRKTARLNQQSIEHSFAVTRTCLPADVQWTAIESAFESRGIWRRLCNLAQASRHRADGDVSHVTGDVHYLAMALEGRRTVLTIHDCGFEQLPPGRRRDVIQHFWYTLPVARVAQITVVSEFTRQRLLALTGCDPAKVRVVPSCIAPDFSPAPPRATTGAPVVLLMGTAPNKNLERVAQALSGIACTARLVGEPSAAQQQALRSAGVPFTSAAGLSRQEVVDEYRNCDLVVFASTYEGFGMPILEGQAVGRPVVTSAVTSMPEVAGDAAVLVDPYDIASIRAGVDRVLRDRALREALVSRGFENVRRFDPAGIARTFVEIYRGLARA
jgi:glycosyltransferase involved in cell wall biosynthesis